MTYLQPRKAPAWREHRVLVGALFAFACAVALLAWRMPYLFPGIFESFAQPFWQGDFSIQSGSLNSPAQLLAENEGLKRQLADIYAALASSSVEAIFEENAELKAQFGRATSTPRILAAVLSRPPLAPYDELVIDVGQDKGISSSTLVYGPDSILIGKVAEALPHSAKVVLFSSSGQTYPVLVGPTHIPATAVGQGGGQYRADVPHGAAVHAGDAVGDASLNDGVFGAVLSISTDAANPFDSILFAPAVDIYQLRWVYIDAPRSSGK